MVMIQNNQQYKIKNKTKNVKLQGDILPINNR